MSGGSTKTTQQNELPQWFEDFTRQITQQAQQNAGIGFAPWSGPDVAAMTPMQMAAHKGTNTMAAAYGLPTAQGTGLPQAQSFGGGVRGYSSAPMFQQQQRQFKQRNPEQYGLLANPGTLIGKAK